MLQVHRYLFLFLFYFKILGIISNQLIFYIEDEAHVMQIHELLVHAFNQFLQDLIITTTKTTFATRNKLGINTVTSFTLISWYACRKGSKLIECFLLSCKGVTKVQGLYLSPHIL